MCPTWQSITSVVLTYYHRDVMIVANQCKHGPMRYYAHSVVMHIHDQRLHDIMGSHM
jgi:hypothetical protein